MAAAGRVGRIPSTTRTPLHRRLEDGLEPTRRSDVDDDNDNAGNQSEKRTHRTIVQAEHEAEHGEHLVARHDTDEYANASLGRRGCDLAECFGV